MNCFKVSHQVAAQLLILKSAHVKGEDCVTITASSVNGVVSSVANASILQLVADGILTQDVDGTCRLHNLDDGSADAQAVLWGDIVKGQLCTCHDEPAVEDWKRYERYDDDGVYTGEHGFACAACKGIVQVG